jgi:hypothetical protein
VDSTRSLGRQGAAARVQVHPARLDFPIYLLTFMVRYHQRWLMTIL